MGTLPSCGLDIRFTRNMAGVCSIDVLFRGRGVFLPFGSSTTLFDSIIISRNNCNIV